MISKSSLRSTGNRVAIAFALFLVSSALSFGQTAPTVYVNPRSGSDDPRVGLKGGLYDAGQAASGLELVTTTPKPGIFAPDLAAIAAANAAPVPPPPAPGAPRGTGPRGPSYGGTNSDLAFAGKYLFSGNYMGINFYDISDPAKIKLVTSLVCPGGQGDVSIYGHLLFMSVEAANGRLDCGTQGLPLAPDQAPPPSDPLANTVPTVAGTPPVRAPRPPDPASADRIKGVRIFDITNIANPKQIVDVQTCRGSHTHTLLVDPKDKDNVYIYVSGSAPVRLAEELGGCSGGDPSNDPNTALFTVVVIKVPLAHPELAKVVNSPRIFSDPQTGDANGLWKGGNHGDGTQTTSATRGCHDITVFSSMGLAAGACSGNGILLDISDPVHPKRLDAVSDPNYAFWHSANFANDGKSVLFTDEWGGGGQPRCRDSDPMNWGADAIFKLKDGKLTLASYYKMPAPQSEFENCVAHNGSLIPVPGRNLLVQSWYQGGISVMDFTDPTHPFEIAFFDRGPIGVGGRRAGGGQWSSYWYNGYIFGSEMARGIDVLKLLPSKYLTQNEIDAASQVHLAELNVQNQPKIIWPENFVTARAYMDQLIRSNALTPEKVSALNAAMYKKKTKQLKALAVSLDKDAATCTPEDADRIHALAKILAKS
ncbi:hypothetical protein [Granulicella sp. dw_53]|uniref:LVIVD repeat-containing protein n=1 Tax=Granulicella sp. dw_53 TaxID=2719792 RepID=UPI001BD5A24C|nr:hypothetical protein [Granulicella sp. dw_53]